MLQFINSILVKRNVDETDDQEFSELTEIEKNELKDLFFIKSTFANIPTSVDMMPNQKI